LGKLYIFVVIIGKYNLKNLLFALDKLKAEGKKPKAKLE